MLRTGNRAPIEAIPKYIQRYVATGRFKIDKETNLLQYKTRITNRTYNDFTESYIKTINEKYLIFIPPSLRASVLKYAHSNFHHGKSRMQSTIINKLGYWWPKIHKHIAAHAQCCPGCQFIKSGSARAFKNTNKMQLFMASKPFEQISVDIVGPLPCSHSMNRYIVTIIDKFSKYCMLIPVKDVTSLTVCQAIDKWTTTFGPPQSILSDNGPQFISAIYKDYCDNHLEPNGIKRKYTSTYYPQCNGQIERLHRWIKERLALISFDGGMNFIDGDDDWSDYLSIIQYTHNSSPTTMTGYSPMNIIFGIDQYEIPQKYTFNPALPAEYIKYLTNRQILIRNSALEKQKLYDQLRKNQYDKNKRIKKRDYTKGDRVLYNIHTHFTGNRRKLGPQWVGPFEILSVEQNKIRLRIIELPKNHPAKDNPMNRYTVPIRGNTINTDNLKEFTCNRTQIKPYYESYNEQYDGIQSPAEIAIKALQKTLDDECDTVNEIQILNNLPKSIPRHLKILINDADSARKLLLMTNKNDIGLINCCNCNHALQCNQACNNTIHRNRKNISILIDLHQINLQLPQ